MHGIVRTLCALLREYEKNRPDPGFVRLVDEAGLDAAVLTDLFSNNVDKIDMEDFEKVLRHLGIEKAFTNAITPQDQLLEYNLEEFSRAWEQKSEPKP